MTYPNEAAACAAFADQVAAEFGPVAILVNNAGITRDNLLARMKDAEWDEVIAVNLTGVFHCCQRGMAVMRDGGAIVSLGSIAALQGFYGQANYAAAKAGVQAMMRVISREAARRGIRANAIAPGVIDTAMAATIPEDVRAAMLQNVPLGRFASLSTQEKEQPRLTGAAAVVRDR